MNRRKIPAGSAIGVKCKKECSEQIRKLLGESKILDISKNPLVTKTEISWPTLSDSIDEISMVLSDADFEFTIEEVDYFQAPPPIDPHTNLRLALGNWFEKNSTGNFTMEKNIPNKWEKFGDIALLAKDSFELGFIEHVSLNSEDRGGVLWDAISLALNVKSIGIQQPIANDAVRSSQAILLNSEDGWTKFLDNEVIFTLDVTKVMFSSGNITERHRIARMNMEDEIIVDCFAGIGYYCLHAIVNAGAKHVHACEMNPNSIQALEKALILNQIGEKLTIYPGDNQESLPKLEYLADRVFLGLLPSSELVWEHAVNCLKQTGGYLHIHMNVEEEKIPNWQKQTIEEINKFAKANGRGLSVVSSNMVKVKWFSPRVRHVVLDLELRP